MYATFTFVEGAEKPGGSGIPVGLDLAGGGDLRSLIHWGRFSWPIFFYVNR